MYLEIAFGLLFLIALGAVFYLAKNIQQLKQQLFKLKFNNPVSGLPNQNFLIDYTADKANESKQPEYCLIYFEIENFGDINHVFGYELANQLIADFSLRIRLFIPPQSQLSHLAINRFCLLLDRQTNHDVADQLCNKIRDSMQMPFKIRGYTVRLRTRFGYGLFKHKTGALKKSLLQLEQMFKETKDNGDQKTLVYTDQLGDQQNLQIRIKNDLKAAIEAGQFIPYFQPIINLSNGQIEKAEMLIRWRHPELGFIKPLDFIPIAEQTGSILQIGKWCRAQAIEHSAHWRKDLNQPIQISINMSPIELMDDGPDSSIAAFIETVRQANIPIDGFVFEITEGSLVQDDATSKQKINEIIAANIELSIDDFGTGFSSIAYLNRFPIKFLKLDISFVRDLIKDSSQEVICDHVIRMAHDLGIKVIAEGIETEEQQAILTALDCDYGQGYLYSPPISATEFETDFLQAARTH